MGNRPFNSGGMSDGESGATPSTSAVIVTHVNEQATDGGKVRPSTRTDAFIKAVKAPVHLPLSGRTMEFDGTARCVAGC